jgi:hypothetical protein
MPIDGWGYRLMVWIWMENYSATNDTESDRFANCLFFYAIIEDKLMTGDFLKVRLTEYLFQNRDKSEASKICHILIVKEACFKASYVSVWSKNSLMANMPVSPV